MAVPTWIVATTGATTFGGKFMRYDLRKAPCLSRLEIEVGSGMNCGRHQ